jgi:hypothetical protein
LLIRIRAKCKTHEPRRKWLLLPVEKNKIGITQLYQLAVGLTVCQVYAPEAREIGEVIPTHLCRWMWNATCCLPTKPNALARYVVAESVCNRRTADVHRAARFMFVFTVTIRTLHRGNCYQCKDVSMTLGLDLP